MNSLRLRLAAFIPLVLAACAIQQPTPVAPTIVSAPAPRPSVADDLLTTLRALQSLSASELASTRDIAREAFERDPAPHRRSRYLLTLAATAPSVTDDERLLTLIEPLLAMPSSHDAATVAISFIVQQAALSRKRLREEIALLRTRATSGAAGVRRDERDTEVRTLKARIDDLEKQLAALKSIDRSVTRR